MGSKRYSRQSFLGENSEKIFANCTIGLIGLGGGGMHIVQQLAHVGFKNYILYDFDPIDESNLNRTVGATAKDVTNKTLKTDIAKRIIIGLHDDASIYAIPTKWQENPIPLRDCDIIFGCVDGFAEREQIERLARRYLIPYIDIGMDVFYPTRVAGQVILSMPGGPCLRCMNFLNDENMSIEAGKYGAAGHNPQVVWPNGVLASSAIGIAVDLLTDWSKSLRKEVYLSYDGNANLVSVHPRVTYGEYGKCNHYPLNETGDPVFRPL